MDFVNGASSNESLIPSGITTNDANLDLTAGAAYKSTATLVVEVLLSTAEHARDAYSIGGNIDLSGSIQLLRSNDFRGLRASGPQNPATFAGFSLLLA